MSDLIERQDVIDFLKLTRDSEYKKSMSDECKHKSVIRSKHDAHVAFCDYLIEYVKQVPTHETPSNTLGALDCVERQKVIDVVGDLPKWGGFESDDDNYLNYKDIMSVLNDKEELPSVKPEPLTDTEQRIFLAAMGREEKVCKQVDDDWRDMDFNVENLVKVCQEIKRKVKGTLWT